MSYNGGYKVIDFKGLTLSSTAVIIPGIYEAIEGNNKVTLASGIVFDGVEYDDVFTEFIETSGDYVAVIGGGAVAVTVTDEDKVTAAEVS